MNRILFLLLLLLSTLLLSCKTEEKELLIMGTHDQVPPFVYIGSDDEVVGLDIEIAKNIAKDLDRELQIKTMSFDELLPAIANGDIDMALCSITITDERKKFADFSISYYEASQVALVRKDDTTFESIKTKEELGANKKLASLTGSTCIITAKGIAGSNDVFEVNLWDNAIDELIAENVDAVIIDKMPARIFASEHENLSVLSRIEFDSEYYGVAVSKGERALLASINNTISRIINSGEYTALIDKYILMH